MTAQTQINTAEIELRARALRAEYVREAIAGFVARFRGVAARPQTSQA
ncbi:RSP_7527 family protein [Jannaschia sp. M317]|nr:hypothetical protein [Jannaschia sp. M317]UWQ19217.1 hypothetical protein K3551_08105 [Jannaschia sp. M317]